jgi:glyceraldehyde 3-phosphate dehydrogenase
MDTNKKINVAINGFGRIGRAFLRVALSRPELNVVAVNDLGDIENLAYLFKYDTAYGISPFDVYAQDGSIFIDDKEIKYFSSPEPEKLPWRDLDIDVVVESTGFFTSFDKAKAHLDGGAKRVVISAPAKGDKVEGIESGTILMGINEEKLATCQITSNASCTTNAGSPIIAILDEKLGIEKAILNTVHAYTASQSIVDGPSKKDWRGGRAGAQNIVPSSTGAAIAVTEVVPQLKGKFDGVSLRVPVVAGSVADITFISKRPTSVEEVNKILEDAAEDPRWEGIFTVTDEQIVSSDIIGAKYASIADLLMTRVVDGNLVKVLAWYDNEMGYTHTLVRHVIKLGGTIK